MGKENSEAMTLITPKEGHLLSKKAVVFVVMLLCVILMTILEKFSVAMVPVKKG